MAGGATTTPVHVSAAIGTDGEAPASTDGGFAAGPSPRSASLSRPLPLGERGKTPYHPPVKRSVTIAGHETSISLEPVFWDALSDAAIAAGLPLNALIARIDVERIAVAKPPNLASALRVWVLRRTDSDSEIRTGG